MPKRATSSPCRTGRCGERTCKSGEVVVVEARANTELVLRCGTSGQELVVETSATANRLVYMIFLCSCAFAIFGRSIGKAEASRRESRTDFARAGPARQTKPIRTVVRHPFDDRAGWLPSARGARRCRGPTGNTGSKPGAGSMQRCQPPFKAYGWAKRHKHMYNKPGHDSVGRVDPGQDLGGAHFWIELALARSLGRLP